jgi:hypothetical protein
MKDKLIIVVLFVGIGVGLSAVVFLLTRGIGPSEEPAQPEPEIAEEPEIVEEIAPGEGTAVIVYGGPADIKTFSDGPQEFALFRNPTRTGGLELAAADLFGSYYFAIDTEGERIVYPAGDPDGIHGYSEVGLVSGDLIRERNSVTQYFIAYPDETSARIMNFPEIPDTGTANRFLSTQFAIITNKGTGERVAAEIDHRSQQQEALLVSEAVARELGLSDGSVAALEIELVDRETTSVGPVR